MRSLTIQREKTVVTSTDTMMVYAEDPNAPERTLNGVPCRLIGELKNGEEKTFIIGEEETRVFVLSVRLPLALLNEFYRVPAGTEPVCLSGKCVFNPAAGNQFRFNDNRDEAVLKNRKQSKTRHVVLIVCAVVLVVTVLFALIMMMKPKAAAPKEFAEQGIHITLTDAFSKTEEEDYTLSYLSKTAGVYIVCDDFASVEGLEDLSLGEYTRYMALANPYVTEDDGPYTGSGYLYYEYSSQDKETDLMYHYFVAFYRAPRAFWIVNFITVGNKYEELRPQFLEWAESVRFD